MAARVERMKQQLKDDGAVAGAASTLRQVEGVAMEPKHAAEIQELFPTKETQPATLGPTPSVCLVLRGPSPQSD
eukprot:5922287-Prorocentrum_lima.AAC.1